MKLQELSEPQKLPSSEPHYNEYQSAALILVQKFYSEVKIWKTAKQCALIAVEEIIIVVSNLIDKPKYVNEQWISVDYWQQVKAEIEKM